MSYYDLYGRMANQHISSTMQNGRYVTQEYAEQLIPADVFRKLMLKKEDEFLDIGCGMGINVIPAASIVKTVHACDHPDILKKLPEIDNLVIHPGNFMEVEFSQTFNKILTYSVLHCLHDETAILKFIEKILNLLNPDGIALLGDIPNVDMKRRFLKSQRGKIFQEEWEEQQKKATTSYALSEEKLDSVIIGDATIMRLLSHIRKAGFHAYAVPQPQNLPFGNSREDILVFGVERTD